MGVLSLVLDLVRWAIPPEAPAESLADTIRNRRKYRQEAVRAEYPALRLLPGGPVHLGFLVPR